MHYSNPIGTVAHPIFSDISDPCLSTYMHCAGKVKAIGVSNYTVTHLEELMQYATISPSVLQVSISPISDSGALA